jgi:hypothetical protein
MSEKYISLPIDQGRVETTPVNNGDQIDFHVANADLLDLTAARALVHQREVDIAFERETRPSASHEIIGITSANLWDIKGAHKREETGETINVVPLKHPRRPAPKKNLPRAA